MKNVSMLSLLWVGLIPLNTDATECRVASGPQTVPLIELYTSEGCSSCPPADQWLSSLLRAPAVGQYSSLAWHIDYWDSLGWKDRFAQPQFAARQRALAAAASARVVYTPQVFISGRDFRGWSSPNQVQALLAKINSLPAQAELQLSMQRVSAQALQLTVSIRPLVQSPLVYYVALKENNLESQVSAGENRNAALHHDAVVRQWLGPFRLMPKGVTTAQHKINLQRDWKTSDLSVVVWVQRQENAEVIQSLSAAICDGAGDD